MQLYNILILICFFCVQFSICSQAPNIEWERAIGGTEDEILGSIQQTSDGGYIVVGYGTSSDGDLTGNNGSNDAYVIKLDNQGIIEWQYNYGGSLADDGRNIIETADGGFIFTGLTHSSDIDVSNNYGFADIWVVKLSQLGILEWEKNYGGSRQEYPCAIKETNDGGYIVAGSSHSSDGNFPMNNTNGYQNYNYFFELVT